MSVSTRRPVRMLLLGALHMLLAAAACRRSRRPRVGHHHHVHAADGTPATGLNRIDEADVLPDFVHRYEPQTTKQKPDRILGKAA